MEKYMGRLGRYDVREVLRDVLELLQSLVMLAAFAGIAWLTYSGLSWLLAKGGLSLTTLQSLSLWYAIGLGGALYWPVRCWRGMRGHWTGNLGHFAFLGLFGPWAILLGYPL